MPFFGERIKIINARLQWVIDIGRLKHALI